MKHAAICFFIGTEAELIKVFPVIRKLADRGVVCRVIASGQNEIGTSRALFYANDGLLHVKLSEEKNIKKSPIGLLSWFFSLIIKRIVNL